MSIERQQAWGVIDSLGDPSASIVENYIMRLERRIEALERTQISPELRERIKVMVEYPGRLPVWGEANWIDLLKDILAATTPEGER